MLYAGDALKKIVVIEELVYLFCFKRLRFFSKKLFLSLPNDSVFSGSYQVVT